MLLDTGDAAAVDLAVTSTVDSLDADAIVDPSSDEKAFGML